MPSLFKLKDGLSIDSRANKMDSVPAPLKGRVAVVTGGSRGLGACIAETFAQHGCTHIAITYSTNKDKAQETEKRIAAISTGIKTFSFAIEITDPKCGKYTVEQSLKGLGVDHIDIMVSSAAKADAEAFQYAEHMTKEHWDEM